MFVERLTIEDIKEYIINYELSQYDDFVKKDYDFNAVSNLKVSDGKITFRIRDIKFKFTDFDYKSNRIISLYDGVHSKRWLNFMYKRFGEEYRQAFLSFREQEKIAVLNATEKRFDEDTEKYGDVLVK